MYTKEKRESLRLDLWSFSATSLSRAFASALGSFAWVEGAQCGVLPRFTAAVRSLIRTDSDAEFVADERDSVHWVDSHVEDRVSSCDLYKRHHSRSLTNSSSRCIVSSECYTICFSTNDRIVAAVLRTDFVIYPLIG